MTTPLLSPALKPIASAVHGCAPSPVTVAWRSPIDEGVALAHWVEVLQGILDVQNAEQQRSAATVWATMDATISSVVAGWCANEGLHIPESKRHRTTEQERCEQADHQVVRSTGFGIARLLSNGHRTPDQRMFDALERHDHPALRRALAAGASIRARFVPDRYDDGRRHGCKQGFREPVDCNGKRPIVFAVLEDDTEAVRLLLDAGVERSDALRALDVVAKRGIEWSGVRAMLETLELQDVLAGTERRGVRARVRARL